MQELGFANMCLAFAGDGPRGRSRVMIKLWKILVPAIFRRSELLSRSRHPTFSPHLLPAFTLQGREPRVTRASLALNINLPISSASTTTNTMADQSAAWPIADQALSQEILDLVQQASHYRQLKKGANEGKSMHIL